MSSEERLSQFLKQHSDNGFCDFCISVETGIDLGEVSSITKVMSLFPDEFERRARRCSRCKNDGVMVTISRKAA